MASNLADVKSKGSKKLGMEVQPHVVLEEDGTEIDDEEYFACVPEQTILMLLRNDEKWTTGRDDMSGVGIDETDCGGDRTQLDAETKRLVLLLRKNLTNAITFSSDQLQLLADADTSGLAKTLGESERYATSIQSACQRHLDEREETKETLALLKLFNK